MFQFLLPSVALAFSLTALPGGAGAATRPALVLQIAVDGLRDDMPARYLDGMGSGGFRRLLTGVIVYSNAHYGHSNTGMIVGHTVLATGADPAAHGMVENAWFDRETGDLAYHIEDPDCELLTAGAGVNRETEIDPTQKVAKVTGRSADNILATTFGDELSVHTAGGAGRRSSASSRPRVPSASPWSRSSAHAEPGQEGKGSRLRPSELWTAAQIEALRKTSNLNERSHA